jgi:hypothetical protein
MSVVDRHLDQTQEVTPSGDGCEDGLRMGAHQRRVLIQMWKGRPSR